MAKVHLENHFPKCITVQLMWVKLSNLEKPVPPLRRQVTPYLPTVTILGIMEAEAGSRA